MGPLQSLGPCPLPLPHSHLAKPGTSSCSSQAKVSRATTPHHTAGGAEHPYSLVQTFCLGRWLWKCALLCYAESETCLDFAMGSHSSDLRGGCSVEDSRVSEPNIQRHHTIFTSLWRWTSLPPSRKPGADFLSHWPLLTLLRTLPLHLLVPSFPDARQLPLLSFQGSRCQLYNLRCGPKSAFSP